MSNVKKQISDMQKNTPKYIQWLMLVAAFIIVVILLTLLLNGNNSKDVKIADDEPVYLIMRPAKGQNTNFWQDGSINWAGTEVGEIQKYTVEISANAPVKITAVRRTKDIPGFADPQQTCVNLGQIDRNISCRIDLEYAPIAPADAETTALFIDWRTVNEPEDMRHTDKLMIVMGAHDKELPPPPVVIPEPVIEPESESDFDSDFTVDGDYNTFANTNVWDSEPVTKKIPAMSDIQREIESVTSVSPFIGPEKPTETTETFKIAETCSDFAFPGYNLSGVQSGWIKPDEGAYYFHPFSDTECNSPTGTYNPDNGIISDINNRGKKIGTDAEHIGYGIALNGTMPTLSNPIQKKEITRARQLSDAEFESKGLGTIADASYIANEQHDFSANHSIKLKEPKITPKVYLGSAENDDMVVSSMPYDRKFILRQYKPIPATIVSEILADRAALEQGLPVRATVDRNVYSDDGRTVIIPTGTLMLGYVTGEIPGPYKAIGRMNINWYQFILPNGVEFNFKEGSDPFSADSQGRSGVPGRGSTDYMEQFLMPMLTAIVPAAVNMIAPISDAFVNQIDLDNNTVVQSGTVRSSELAKNEIINAWNQVAQKLLVDMMDNTVPPFSIAAGTRITVYSPVDLVVTCGTNTGKECSIKEYGQNKRRSWKEFRGDGTMTGTTGGAGRIYNTNDESYIGQVRSFNWDKYCDENGKIQDTMVDEIYANGLSYNDVLFYCQSSQYQAINTARQEALYQDQQKQFQQNNDYKGSQQYNQNVLELEYDEAGAIINPFQSAKAQEQEAALVLTCIDGTLPDANGCCTGEIYTDMGEMGFNCCPETGGDCFPPMM